MGKQRVLIMIGSATRDALSQLLVAYYLRRKGVHVLLCNQLTFVSMYERYRPDVVFVSWMNSEPMNAYLHQIRHQTRIVLVDQEGGRMGERAFKRAMAEHQRAKIRLASAATRVIAWGASQTQWLKELECVEEARIVVTGCPRLDPYCIPDTRLRSRKRFIGVTLRTDRITAQPRGLVQAIFESLFMDPREGLTPGLPLRAQYEDWVWQAVAVVRYMLKVVVEVSQRTTAPIVLRPGPWEHPEVYEFLRTRLPQVSVEPAMLQHEYVRDAFVTVDASSALGLEALLVGTPVISVNALVPGLEDHVGGEEGTRLKAPYRKFYWHPTTVEEAVNSILQAERGELALAPTPEGMGHYFREYLDWPSQRPASFRIGDLILELLELAPDSHLAPCDAAQMSGARDLRRAFYRLPGSASLQKTKLFWDFILRSPDRGTNQRYHYFDWVYPHHQAIEELFASLYGTYEAQGGSPRAGRAHGGGSPRESTAVEDVGAAGESRGESVAAGAHGR